MEVFNKMTKQSIPLEPREAESGGLQQKRWVWTQFPLVGGIVVITTVDREGRENAAPKNWCIPCAYKPPMLLFICDTRHDTAKNIMDTGEFVANIPSEDIFMKVIKMDKTLPRGKSEIKYAELASIPSEKVKPPRIKECRAHAECVLEWYKELGPTVDDGTAVVFVGRVVAASADEDLLGVDCETRQANLKQMVAWPDGFSMIVKAKNRPKKP